MRRGPVYGQADALHGAGGRMGLFLFANGDFSLGLTVVADSDSVCRSPTNFLELQLRIYRLPVHVSHSCLETVGSVRMLV